MNWLVKKTRVYRLVTLGKIIPQYYKTSKRIARQQRCSTLRVYFDMLQSLVKYGASDYNYEWLEFWGRDDAYKDSFITWRRNFDIMFKFNTPHANQLFLDKVRWNKRFSKYVKRDWIYCKESTSAIIRQFLTEHKTVILKQIDGACGVGISKYESADILAREDLFISLVGGNYILEQLAVNCAEMQQFTPNSLNTIRVITCIDNEGKSHIIASILRIGNGVTHTDNFFTGGIASYVDSETGIVTTDGVNSRGERFVCHPVSNIKFKGFKISKWDEIRKLCLSLSKEVPEARFVGWDVVMTPGGLDILEGNIPPGEELPQLDLKGKYHQVMKML